MQIPPVPPRPRRDHAPDFAHVRTWVFDLDNTLYPPRMRLFDQIEVRMTDWVMRNLNLGRTEADRLRATYWRQHGTTLAGLMAEHQIDPWDFLTHVHDLDFSMVEPEPALRASITGLPGRRIVYTNADTIYAAKVLEARGLSNLFDAVYGVEHAGFRPKPEQAAFDAVFARDGLDPTAAAMFEDDPRNLAVPHAMGMQTVLVAPDPMPARHIRHHTDDLAEFLGRMVTDPAAA
jgi:putative hydrolase of the HAD superfamily